MKVGDIYKTNNGGDLVVIDYKNARNVDVEFLKTGYRTTAQADKIRKGIIKDPMLPVIHGVGYYGCKSRDVNSNRKAYDAWTHMLYRCYSESALETHPTYKDCYVCDEWHCYKSFLTWFNENYPDDGLKYQLDKDIKVEGNKEYSPEKCSFVTSYENNIKAHAKSYIVTDHKGAEIKVFNLADFCRKNKISHSNLSATISGRRKHTKGYKARVES